MNEVVVDDILLNSESYEPLKHMWNDQQDRYLLQILDTGLNKVPSSFYKLRCEPMEKADQFLAQEKAKITTKNAKVQNYRIYVPLIKQTGFETLVGNARRTRYAEKEAVNSKTEIESDREGDVKFMFQ